MPDNKEQTDDKQKATTLSPRDIESQAESARIKAEKDAADLKLANKAAKKPKKRSAPKQRNTISKKQRDESYKRTIKRVQSELPLPARAFSKVIHNKAIENISDFIGATIARPNAVLTGSIVAFTLTLITYTVSKTIGYKLSGFETIAAFIIGWLLGIIYDYFKVLATGKKS